MDDTPELPDLAEDEFMIAIIPDTQVYTYYGTSEFDDATVWIAEHANDSNKKISMVLHVGDIVLFGDETAFARVDAALGTLDTAGVPYLLTTGNHDYADSIPDIDHANVAAYEAAFPQSQFTGQAGWVGGFYEEGRSENSYRLATIGGNDYLFIMLEFGPRDAVLTWAVGILDTYPTRDAIIITHCYMYRDGTWCGTGDEWNPHDIMPAGADCNDGDEIWAALKSKANIVWIQNGHDGIVAPWGWVQARRQETGIAGI